MEIAWIWPILTVVLLLLLGTILGILANVEEENADRIDGLFSKKSLSNIPRTDWFVIFGAGTAMGFSGLMGTLFPMVAWINWVVFFLAMAAMIVYAVWLCSWVDKLSEFVIGVVLLLIPYACMAIPAANLNVALEIPQLVTVLSIVALAVAWARGFRKEVKKSER